LIIDARTAVAALDLHHFEIVVTYSPDILGNHFFINSLT
jgi:hypothetical protein